MATPAVDALDPEETMTQQSEDDITLPNSPLSKDGPWWVFASDDGLWAVNQDGSGLTRILNSTGPDPKARAYRFAPSPSGGQLAVIEIENPNAQSVPVLKLVYLPGAERETISFLHPRAYDPSGYPDSLDRWAATGLWNAVSWSPDGNMLAFNAVIDGESGDLYTYDTVTDAIDRLSSGPTEAVFPTWSPDAEMIVHGAVERLNLERSGSGYDYTSVWAAAADGSTVNLLFNSDVVGFENVLGWLSTREALIDTETPNDNPFCSYHDLRIVDVHNAETQLVLSGSYAQRAFHAPTQSLVFSVSDGPGCDSSLSPGIYLQVLNEDFEPQTIVEDVSYEIEWSPEAGLYFAETDKGALAISNSGDFIDLFVPEGAYRSPLASSDSNTLAWRSQEGLWIGSLQDSKDKPPRKIFSDWVHEMSWSPDGDHVLFLTSDSLYVASAPAFTPVLIGEVKGRRPTWVSGPGVDIPVASETSLTNPAPPGYAIYDGALRISVLEVVSPADEEIQAASTTNPAASSGFHYLMVRLELRCAILETTCVVFDDVLFQVFDSSDAAYPALDHMVRIPELLKSQMIDGGRTVEGVLIFAVPSSAKNLTLMYSRPISGEFFFDLELSQGLTTN